MERVDGTEAGPETGLDRRAARLLVLDPDDRVLLLRLHDSHRPDQPYWLTPGGGVEDGEELIGCAVRELYEETGLRVAPSALVGPVHRETVEFRFEGDWYRQEQEFFTVRAERDWPVRPTALTEVERRVWLGYRWWTVAELEASTDRYYPEELPDLLRSVG